jgi:hypothetical protein
LAKGQHLPALRPAPAYPAVVRGVLGQIARRHPKESLMTDPAKKDMTEMKAAFIDGFLCAVTLRDLRVAAEWLWQTLTAPKGRRDEREAILKNVTDQYPAINPDSLLRGLKPDAFAEREHLNYTARGRPRKTQ